MPTLLELAFRASKRSTLSSVLLGPSRLRAVYGALPPTHDAFELSLQYKGIDELDDGVLIGLAEGLELSEAVEEPGAVERQLVGLVAGEEVVDGGVEGVGELEEASRRSSGSSGGVTGLVLDRH